MALDHLSLATIPITPLFEGTTLPEATGFVWKRRDRHYLVTNWHVASATHAAEELRGSVALLPVNDLAPGKLAIMVGMEVFILGYPFGSALPVWKRGSIASEPDLVKITTRYYLVDTASRPGMSGSPVILRSRNNHILESSNWVVTDDRKPIDKIIGVYSGRTDDLPGEAQIGMVWHADYIDEIIDHGKIDV
jgi:hypothetical protein